MYVHSYTNETHSPAHLQDLISTLAGICTAVYTYVYVTGFTRTALFTHFVLQKIPF